MWDILHSGKAQGKTRDTYAEIWDVRHVPENSGWLAPEAPELYFT